ncbi:uncharacterized protein BDW47DRAFT_89175 [Aspergillus candidus]|uniref:Uncharacterized protein n=1 Tax=Aspergillus candidus TaxID=41067 RepID=A0A2I2FIY9_ASPCN|nr:hypothetical protein BDW47DRAFT_89175 [Aspergillus candidus]PLB40583.1 hypothetical protein BDW47DRAFT_89175 [Aspergillus candidus]
MYPFPQMQLTNQSINQSTNRYTQCFELCLRLPFRRQENSNPCTQNIGKARQTRETNADNSLKTRSEKKERNKRYQDRGKKCKIGTYTDHRRKDEQT